MRGPSSDNLGWIVLLGAFAALFGPALLTGAALFSADGTAYYLPQRAVAFDALRHGVMPFWNPYNFGGCPLWASSQHGVLFVGNWAFLVLPPFAAMNVSVALAYAMAGGFTYVFARACDLPRPAAQLAALAYAGSGFLVGHMEHLTYVQGAALLPAALWVVERYRQTFSPRWAIAIVAVVASQIVVGHFQMFAYAWAVVAAFALVRSASLPRPQAGAFLGQLGLAVGLGLGLCLIQIGPLHAFLAASQRGQLGFTDFVAPWFTPRQLVTFLFPAFFGGQPSARFPVVHWGEGPFTVELIGYAGLATVMLAIVAVQAARRTPGPRFWLGVALVAGALMMGPLTPLNHLLYVLPPFNVMRASARHVMELDFALAMLAGHGLAALLVGEPGARARAMRVAAGGVLAALLAVFAGVVAYGPTYAARLAPYVSVDMADALRPGQPAFWVPLLMGALAAGALWLTFRRREAPRPTWILVALALDLGVFAQAQVVPVMATVPPPLPRPWIGPEQRVFAVPDAYYMLRDLPGVSRWHLSGYGMLLGERHLDGTEAFLPDRTSLLLGRLNSYGYPLEPGVFGEHHHGLDVLSVSQLRVGREALGRPGWAEGLASPRWRRGPDDQDMVVLTNTHALPRAWRVEAAVALPPVRVNARMMADPAFDPARLALLDEGAPAPVGLAPGTVTARTIDLNTIETTTEGPGPGFVVLGEGFSGGWRAFVRDQELPVRRVDGLVMGAEVPAGAHVVRWRYVPEGWSRAVSGSLAACLAIALWAAWLVSRRRAGAPGRSAAA